MIVLDEYNYLAEAIMERQRRQQRQRIRLSDEERKILQQIVRKQTEKQVHVIRAMTILYADQGQQHQEITPLCGRSVKHTQIGQFGPICCGLLWY